MDDTSIQVFSSQQFGELRALKDVDGEPWFIAQDVCRALGTDVKDVRSVLECDEVSNLDTIEVYKKPGRSPLIVSEAGLYNLVLRSRKPEAKPFRRWVTHEVLPSIRRSGGYIVTDGSESNEDLLARAVLVANEAIQRKDAQLKEQQRQLYEKDTTIIEQGVRIDELAPKAGVYDTVINVKGTMTITDAARYLAQYDPLMNRKRLFALLRADGMICQGSNAPTKRGIETGRFVQIMSTRRDGKSNEPYARMTQKGFDWCITAYCTTPLID